MHPAASVCFRQLPWKSAMFWTADGRWGIIRIKTEKSPKWKQLGRNGEIIDPSASVSFRGHPRCVWKEDATWGIIQKKTEKCQKWKTEIGRVGKLLLP